LGALQIYHAVGTGYFEARSLAFLESPLVNVMEWLRLPGDVLFIVGTLPVLYLGWIGVRHRVPATTLEEPREILFTEVTSPAREGE
jgi:nitric oxide reductase subunit B